MGQFGFFDADRRLAAISAKGDPLEMIAVVVPFESYRTEIEAAVLTPANEKKYDVTDASVHDSQKFDGLLNQANMSVDVYADSAYRSAETEAKLSLRGLRSRIHQRANRNHPLSKAQEDANRHKSKVRARIEHVFGAQQTSPGGRIVRTIGIARPLQPRARNGAP